MPNLADILDTPASEIERPKPLPVGSYVAMVKGRHREDVSSKKGTPFVEFTLQLLEAMDDVDPDDLQEALTKPSGDVIPLREKTVRATYYVTEDAKWRLKKFLTDLGIDADGVSLKQMLDEAPGKHCRIVIKHQTSEDGEATFANVSATARIA